MALASAVPTPTRLSSKDSEDVFPSILGHEDADIVREVGVGVTSVKKDDNMIIIYIFECCQGQTSLSQKSNLCTAIQGNGLIHNGTSRFPLKGQPI